MEHSKQDHINGSKTGTNQTNFINQQPQFQRNWNNFGTCGTRGAQRGRGTQGTSGNYNYTSRNNRGTRRNNYSNINTNIRTSYGNNKQYAAYFLSCLHNLAKTGDTSAILCTFCKKTGYILGPL